MRSSRPSRRTCGPAERRSATSTRSSGIEAAAGSAAVAAIGTKPAHVRLDRPVFDTERRLTARILAARGAQSPAPRRPLPGQHCGRAVDQRPGAPPARIHASLTCSTATPFTRRPTAPSSSAEAPRRRQAAQWRALASLLPAQTSSTSSSGDARPQSLQYPILRRSVRIRLCSSTLKLHIWKRLGAARRRQEGGRRDRRQLGRDPLGAGGDGDPAGDRPLDDHPVPPRDRNGPSSSTPPRLGGGRGRSTSSRPAKPSTSTCGSSRASATTRRSRCTARPTS